jgi:hypothetical protein
LNAPSAPAGRTTGVRYWDSAGRKPALIVPRPDEQRITDVVELRNSPNTGEEAGKQPADDRERGRQRSPVKMVLLGTEWARDRTTRDNSNHDAAVLRVGVQLHVPASTADKHSVYIDGDHTRPVVEKSELHMAPSFQTRGLGKCKVAGLLRLYVDSLQSPDAVPVETSGACLPAISARPTIAAPSGKNLTRCL